MEHKFLISVQESDGLRWTWAWYLGAKVPNIRSWNSSIKDAILVTSGGKDVYIRYVKDFRLCNNYYRNSRGGWTDRFGELVSKKEVEDIGCVYHPDRETSIGYYNDPRRR